MAPARVYRVCDGPERWEPDPTALVGQVPASGDVGVLPAQAYCEHRKRRGRRLHVSTPATARRG